ncbi:hypothetical protein MLD38_012061 [Melastoma candidum]|uniref:Uncharacterized protein n=1 Tax=Melastoma candidum TaxID=119954 RepID=A0ACB9R992_9MYRT|nr:hypothetical protein MLD38_012061 [Melastoma candidum]
MAMFLALQSPEVKVIGLTTIYGNVYTSLATRNALHYLLEVAGRSDIPVAEGSHVTITVRAYLSVLNITPRSSLVGLLADLLLLLKKGTKLRIASFIHGADGLGNQNFPPLLLL